MTAQLLHRVLLATSIALALTSGALAANEASEATRAANAALLKELPFGDKTSFEQAHRGFIAPLPTAEVKGKGGNLIWNPAEFDFIKEGAPAPDTVNPSLWRQRSRST